MSIYYVQVPEIWYQTVKVESDTEEEAIEMVQEGNSEDVENTFEYSHTLEPSDTPWKVAEVDS